MFTSTEQKANLSWHKFGDKLNESDQKLLLLDTIYVYIYICTYIYIYIYIFLYVYIIFVCGVTEMQVVSGGKE